MIRRRKEELTVFSIATLDVFASAMGVFMLISVVLFPYYMKNADAIAARDTARAQAAAAQRANAEAQSAAAAAIVAAQAAQDLAQKSSQEAAEMESRARAAESQLRQTFLLILINWSTIDDVDLHVRDPTGAWFSWDRPRIQGRPGELSEDVLRGPGNEVWQVESATPGVYFVCAHRFSYRTTGPVRVRGSVYHQDGRLALNEVQLAMGESSRTLPLAAIHVDDEGKVRLQPARQASCPRFRSVEYDPKA